MAAPILVSADKQSTVISGATSITVTKPTNLADNDVLYACLSRDNSDASDAITAPSGWTVLDSAEVDNGTYTCGIYRKVIVSAAGEPADYTWSWTSSEKAVAWIIRVTGADTTTPEDVTPSNNSGTSTTPKCLSITTVTADTLILAVGGISNKVANNWTAPAGMTEFFDIVSSGGGGAAAHASAGAAEVNQAGISATGDKDFTVLASKAWAAFLIAVRPAGAGADQTANGAPSVPIPIASGTAKVIKKATGAVVIAVILASGTAVIERSASGAPGMSAVQAAGGAEVIHPSSGAVSVPIPTAVGVAEVKNTSSGAPVIPLVTAAGTASVSAGAHTANGAPVIPLITASGAAEVINISSGAASIPLVIAAGTATVTAAGAHTANGAPSVPLPTASGVAEIINTASGATSIPAVQAAGVAEIKNTASGAVVIPSITAAGIAETKKIATGAVPIPIPIVTGTAEVKNTAIGAPVLPSIVAAGVVGVTRVASGVPSIAAITAAGVASIGAPAAAISGTLAFTKATIQVGVKQVITTLTAETWVAAGTPFDQVRQIILNGFTAAQSEALGWNREVRDKLPVTAVVRTSDTVVTLTLVAAPDYDITANETCTVTVPAEALVSSIAPLVATPTISILSDAPIPTAHFLGHDF